MSHRTTQIIKGVAILFMVMHHALLYWFFVDDTSSESFHFLAIFKICVAMYAFLTGYCYFFHKGKTLRYGFKKIWGLLQRYWLQMALIFFPFAIWGGCELSVSSFVVNLFGLLPNLNWFAWYVFFYIFAMLLLPFVTKFMNKGIWLDLAIGVVVPYLLSVVVHFTPWYGNEQLVTDLFSCLYYFPSLMIGFICARHGLLAKLSEILRGNRLLAAVLAIAVLVIRYFLIAPAGFLLDVVYGPLFIGALAIMFEGSKDTGLFSRGLFFLGAYSTEMWFFHAVFFSSCTASYMAPFVLFSGFPPLELVLCVLFSLAGAYVLQRLLSWLQTECRLAKARISNLH